MPMTDKERQLELMGIPTSRKYSPVVTKCLQALAQAKARRQTQPTMTLAGFATEIETERAAMNGGT